jgi:hypothetical protein
MPTLREHLRSSLLLALLIGSMATPLTAAAASLQAPRVRYLSPAPGARLVLPETNIIVRLDRAPEPDAMLDPTAIVVLGSRSGTHTGTTRLAEDGRTLLFRPDREFVWGEKVTVRLAQPMLQGAATSPERISFSFTIASAKPPRLLDSAMQELRSELGAPSPDRDISSSPMSATRADGLPPGFPAISSTVYQPTAPGNLFLSSFSFSGPNNPYLLILDNYGAPQFYQQMPSSCFDFKVQPNGLITYYDQAAGRFFALDADMNEVDDFACGNGYITDLHELRLLPNGHALLMSYDGQFVDMSAVVPGGNPNAIVTGLVIQELDHDKNVVFQWRSWDHFQITDATHENLTAPTIDYVHGNAIEVDADGNLLISSRHMDEITKIDRETGDVLWRWGGKHNEFTFVGDTLQFSHQHAIRRLANGNYSLYDNGNWHDPPFSRAVEYALDDTARTAERVWEYRNTPDEYGLAMGYVQRLDNGNTLIGWGTGKPDIIEVAPDGTKLMEMTLPTGVYTYRAYRFEWTVPVSVPLATLPSGVSLSAGEPNPLRDRTQMTLDLSARARVSLTVYDLSGREVLNALDDVPFEAGKHLIRVDLSNRAPGLYFCRLTTNGFSATRKLLLIH